MGAVFSIEYDPHFRTSNAHGDLLVVPALKIFSTCEHDPHWRCRYAGCIMDVRTINPILKLEYPIGVHGVRQIIQLLCDWRTKQNLDNRYILGEGNASAN